MALSEDVCKALGGVVKDTLIYELDMLAAVFSLHLWCKDGDSNIHVWFGDNNSVRYALIRASSWGSSGNRTFEVLFDGRGKQELIGLVCTCAYGSKHQ